MAATAPVAATPAPAPKPAAPKSSSEAPLSQYDTKLVQHSFAKVETIAEVAAKMFYDRLFAIDPSAQALFSGDMEAQGRRLMAMIAAPVGGLDDLAGLVPVVEELGARHQGYGVKEAHYGIIGAALFWTLEQGLGDAFTPEVTSAWANVYAVLAETLIAAQEEASVAA